MLSINRFLGINNVQPSERLKSGELTAATDVDFGLSGEVSRRDGYTEVIDECHKNLHQAAGFMLATRNGDLIARSEAGVTTVLYPALGVERVWYCNLPDGRTAFSNGNICGLTDGLTATKWGVPIPPSVGASIEAPGELAAGTYRWGLTFVRQSDKLESGLANAPSVELTQGGIVLTGLPTLAGHDVNVYLTTANGSEFYLAGQASAGMFSFTGANHELNLPCRTDNLQPPPAGTVMAFWRGRVLLALGNILLASRTNQWESLDLRRDFKQMSAAITLIQPVDDGVYVGTTAGLAFLSGKEFDKLTYQAVLDGPVVLGSGAAQDGKLIRLGRDVGEGSAMLCIADGGIVAGFNGGLIERLTQGRYETDATEVWATVRDVRGVPQYVAIPL